MTAADLLRGATNVAFIALFVATLVPALRRPRADRVTIAVLFALPALAVSLGWVRDLTGVAAPALLTTALAMAIPYATLRAVGYLADVPRVADGLALAGLAGSIGLSAIFPQQAGAQLPAGVLIALVAYFFVVEAYAAWVTIREARHTRGVTHARLVAAAAGSLLLGLAILAVIVALVIPVVAGATQLFALASTIAYFMGFAPPRGLREAWQAEGLRDFLGIVSSTGRLRSTTAVMSSLARGCATVLGAPGGAVGAPGGGGRLRLVTDDGTVYEATPEQTVGADAIAARAPVAGTPRPGAAWASGMRVVLAAPVLAGEEAIGFVSVFARRSGTFIEEDLRLLGMLAAQVSVVLQNRRLYDDLASANEELERRLHELNAVNGELAAFAYSVSHDLRAPLRSLDGFSNALLQKYDTLLDDTGKRYLGFVRESSQEMGELIDDLLRLSLVSRSEMKHEQVDLSAVSAEVVARLRRQDPERTVQVRIEPGLVANGDPALIRAALENLIGNSWKFTSKRQLAEITVGRVEPGRDTFFVRDNGAGFDMRYAGKLFGAFQRLHAKNEFPGTGIGLATVQRVVHRHGGEVWATSEVDHGTTLYFTFGPRRASDVASETGGTADRVEVTA